jgi:putative ABC transport system ATP-binding protein
MIKISQLDFSYTGSAFRLRIPELTVPSGRTVAIVGPSGCGKTTLLKLLAGILTPVVGTVMLGNVTLGDCPDAVRRRFRIGKVGFVFQDFGLIEYLNVLENVLLPVFIHPELPLAAEVRDRAMELCRQTGLTGMAGDRIDKLSHGEKQRVAICRAMLNRPAYLFADEPTGNLDKTNGDHILDLLFAQVAETGATLVVVTHDPGVLDRFDAVVQCEDYVEAHR